MKYKRLCILIIILLVTLGCCDKNISWIKVSYGGKSLFWLMIQGGSGREATNPPSPSTVMYFLKEGSIS